MSFVTQGESLVTYEHAMLHKKVCLAVFNRATFSRCKTVISELAKFTSVDLTVTLSSALLWEEFGSAGDSYINKMEGRIKFVNIPIEYPDKTHYGMTKASSQILSRFSDFFHENEFDLVIVVADRFETLPCAMAASYLNIPVVHIQGGEMTGNIDDRVRHAVTQLADYHFVCTKKAKEYVYMLGQQKHRIYNVGCPSMDIIKENQIRRRLAKERYIICMFHPETDNPDEAFDQTERVMRAVLRFCQDERYKCYWFYPNPDPGREEVIKLLDKVIGENPAWLVKAVNKKPEEFLTQLASARLIIGNSSCGIRESSFLGLPSINVGERQGIRERSFNVTDVGYKATEIYTTLCRLARLASENPRLYKRSYLYGAGKAGQFIANYIARLVPERKQHLDYPFRKEMKERHFGDERFNDEKRKEHPQFRAESDEALEGNISSEHIPSPKGDAGCTEQSYS